MKIQQGEIYEVDFTGYGYEIQGKRPAIVVQGANLNLSPKYQLTIICPITGSIRDLKHHYTIYPTRQNGLIRKSQVKCEQIHTIDRSRLVRKIGYLDRDEIEKIIQIIRNLVYR